MHGAQSARPQRAAAPRVGHRRTIRQLGESLLDHYRRPRVLGLDILRIVAALTIVAFHGNVIRGFGRNVFTTVVHADGYLAVDIFFVLSGWLLTRQVLRMRSRFRSPLGFAVRFWTRRWVRTLPPYWFMLLAVFLGYRWLDHQNFPDPLTVPLLVTHALFLQTVIPPNAYGVSWSLVAEEWFYLLLPFVVLLTVGLRSGRLILGLGLTALLVPTTIRALLLTTPMEWGPGILVTPQARFEGLVVGALLAAASVNASWWVTQVISRRRTLFGLGLVFLAGNLAAGVADTGAYRIFGILAFNLSIAMLMPFLSQLEWPARTSATLMMGVTYLSELTYPLYLLHSVIQLHWTRLTGSMRFADAFLDVAVLLVAASLLHLAIERPFLALRNRSDARSTAPAPTWKEPFSPRAAPPTVPGSAAPRRGRPTSMIEKQEAVKKRPPGSRS